MKEIVLNQILPKIEKLIEPYLNPIRGNPADKKFYFINDRGQNWQSAVDSEKDIITKLIEQANIIKHASTLPSADDSFFSGIYGSLKIALDHVNTINCHGGIFSGFYHSKLQDNLAYETKQIYGAVSQYEVERQRKQAEATAVAASTAAAEQAKRMAQIEKSFNDLQLRLQGEAANNAALLAKAQWYEQELANAYLDPNYLIGKTPAQLRITTPAHPSQRLASATPSHPNQQSAVNPANARGTLTSATPKTPLEFDREYLNKYFGELPTKILEKLSILSNMKEFNDIAISAIQERLLNFKTPAPRNLITQLQQVLYQNRPDKANIEQVLQELTNFVSRDNTGDTHKNIVEALLKIEDDKLLQAATSKTVVVNVDGVTASYQVLNRIKEFFKPRTISSNIKWKRELLPDMPSEFIGELNKTMVNEMDFPVDIATTKKQDILSKLTELDKKIFTQPAPAKAAP